jgi:hypothetical protein
VATKQQRASGIFIRELKGWNSPSVPVNGPTKQRKAGS